MQFAGIFNIADNLHKMHINISYPFTFTYTIMCLGCYIMLNFIIKTLKL